MDLHVTEFRTRTKRFSGWEEKIYWVVVWLSGAVGLVTIYRWLDYLALHGWAFWGAFALSAVVYGVVVAAVAMGLFIYLGVNVPGFGGIELRGRTRAQSDGSIVVESTLNEGELARCVPQCKKSIVVGMDRFEQVARCESRPASSEPVFACLYCDETTAGGSEWIRLFSITHDQRDVVVCLNDAEIRFPYHGRPDYLKIAGRVAHSCPAFAALDVRDASAK